MKTVILAKINNAYMPPCQRMIRRENGLHPSERRSFSFDSVMTHCSLECGNRFLLRRQPCLCSIRDSGEVIVLENPGEAPTYVIQDS